MTKTVFDFKIRFVHDEDDYQHRYVVAETEEEAYKKIEKHRKQLLKDGYADFIIIDYPTVEIDYVIA